MKQNYFIKTLSFLLLITVFSSCGSDDSEDQYVPVSPIVLDLEALPLAKLSDYKFFIGEMKNMQPGYKVLPYDINSSLFTDYAQKKRFVWMPAGQQATYVTDSHSLNFPVGTVLIKNFYYENVQPANSTRIIETRMMIKKETGWEFANYLWNDAQTEAVLDVTGDGGTTTLTWMHEGSPKTIDYQIPSRTDCFTCHKDGPDPSAIGPKPQNLNKDYAYADGTRNQLSKWIYEGYLNTAPNNITSTVNWQDGTKPIDLRVRSYIDSNCAHCHKEGGHCDYMPMRLAFNETANPVNLGICVTPYESEQTYIVAAGNVEKSALHARMNTNEASRRMPLIGRSIIHREAVSLMEDWITTMDAHCD